MSRDEPEEDTALKIYVNCLRQCDILPVNYPKYASCIDSCERLYNYHTKCPIRHYYKFKERFMDEIHKLSSK